MRIVFILLLLIPNLVLAKSCYDDFDFSGEKTENYQVKLSIKNNSLIDTIMITNIDFINKYNEKILQSFKPARLVPPNSERFITLSTNFLNTYVDLTASLNCEYYYPEKNNFSSSSGSSNKQSKNKTDNPTFLIIVLILIGALIIIAKTTNQNSSNRKKITKNSEIKKTTDKLINKQKEIKKVSLNQDKKIKKVKIKADKSYLTLINEIRFNDMISVKEFYLLNLEDREKFYKLALKIYSFFHKKFNSYEGISNLYKPIDGQETLMGWQWYINGVFEYSIIYTCSFLLNLDEDLTPEIAEFVFKEHNQMNKIKRDEQEKVKGILSLFKGKGGSDISKCEYIRYKVDTEVMKYIVEQDTNIDWGLLYSLLNDEKRSPI